MIKTVHCTRKERLYFDNIFILCSREQAFITAPLTTESGVKPSFREYNPMGFDYTDENTISLLWGLQYSTTAHIHHMKVTHSDEYVQFHG